MLRNFKETTIAFLFLIRQPYHITDNKGDNKHGLKWIITKYKRLLNSVLCCCFLIYSGLYFLLYMVSDMHPSVYIDQNDTILLDVFN